MSKVKLNIVGNTFAGDNSATHGKDSKHIQWVRDGSGELTVHVDDGLFADAAPGSYGWILESQAIIPNVYAQVYSVLDKYEAIFTHCQELLDLDPKFKLGPVGTHWIKEPGVKPKFKLTSMVASNKRMCLGHTYRHAWIQKLRDQVDFFGRGFNPIDSKEEALDEYMFSVAIENCCVPNYFTEKIGDCFATGTIPVYLGCSNIDKFFNPEGIILLNHELDFSTLTPDLYYSKIDAITENAQRIQEYEIPEDFIYETYLKETWV